MKKSEHIYNKFKSMFLVGEGENFAAVSFVVFTLQCTLHANLIIIKSSSQCKYFLK